MMRRSLTTAAMAATLLSPSVAQDITSSSCVDGLFMLVARGTNEDPGPGATGMLAERIADRIDDSDVVALDYPATFTDPLYTTSVVEGTDALRAAVRNYTESCPDGKIAVFGYSQGAQVVGNVFCGGGFGDDDEEEALPKELVEDHVISIVLFGDPSHQVNASYNEGTSENDGLFARPDISACEDYSFLKSYCDTGDVYCDSGDVRAVHGQYLQNYGQDVVEDVIEAWNDATDGDVDTDPGPAFAGPSGNVTETPGATGTPGATPSETQTSTETQTETATESETGSETGSGDGDDEGEGQGGGDDEDAAVGLSCSARR